MIILRGFYCNIFCVLPRSLWVSSNWWQKLTFIKANALSLHLPFALCDRKNFKRARLNEISLKKISCLLSSINIFNHYLDSSLFSIAYGEQEQDLSYVNVCPLLLKVIHTHTHTYTLTHSFLVVESVFRFALDIRGQRKTTTTFPLIGLLRFCSGFVIRLCFGSGEWWIENITMNTFWLSHHLFMRRSPTPAFSVTQG